MMWILVILGLVIVGLLVWFLMRPAAPTTPTNTVTQLGNTQGPLPAPNMPYGAGGFMPPWMGQQPGVDPNLQAGLQFGASLAGSVAKVLSSYFSSED